MDRAAARVRLFAKARAAGADRILAVMVPYSLYGCRLRGLDIPAWARLGLIDAVVLSTPFLATLHHDIRDTKLKVPGVPVYAGCDRNLRWGPGGVSRVVPMQAYRAMALNYLRQGADGIHLFNVMAWTMNHAKASEAVRR